MVCSAVSVGAEWRKVRMCAVTRPSAYFAVSSNQNTGLRPRDQSEAGHWSSFPVLWPSVWLWCSVSIVLCLALSPSSELNKPQSLPGKRVASVQKFGQKCQKMSMVLILWQQWFREDWISAKSTAMVMFHAICSVMTTLCFHVMNSWSNKKKI